jgi:small subunit ribosomal protein S17
MTGEVVSNKMDKTVVVRVRRAFRHPLYGKTVYQHKKFMAHDENNECEIGDEVVLVESRPLSKNKRWVVERVVREDASARTAALDVIAAVPEAIADAASSAAETVAGMVTGAVEAVKDALGGDDDEDDEAED